MKYSVETYDEVISDIKPLLDANANEGARYKTELEYIPNYYQYKALEDNGFLVVLTARNEGELIAYCLIFTIPHMHYSTSLFGTVDVFYVTPKQRGKMVGSKLIKFSEEVMKELGVKVLLYHSRTEHDYSAILKRRGFEEIETVYGKTLGE